ncbi:MAG: response regulator [Myxococcales bacterium]|nr:response regulator [Myxococcales bacterium]
MSQTHTILIVDDDRPFCTALAGALRRRGHTVVLAHDFDDALAEADAWSPDRAVVDLRMPGRGGLELVDALRRAHPALRMVVLTGYGSIATAVEAMKAGAVHYMTKPAEVDEILAAFERTEARVDTPDPVSASPRRLEEVEWEHLQRVLTDAGGNVSEAARRLGMHRRSLQRKLARGRPGGDEGGDEHG